MHYWFKPKRWGKWVAVYYPTSWQGWLTTLILAVVFVKMFWLADQHSHSGSDTLTMFAPWAIIIFLISDLICFRKGEYPWWWRKNNK